jgi:hypothetical protein
MRHLVVGGALVLAGIFLTYAMATMFEVRAQRLAEANPTYQPEKDVSEAPSTVPLDPDIPLVKTSLRTD